MNKTKRVRIRVSGIVQGVFFRATTKDVAQRIGLRGIVKNLPDGSVEIVAEGEEDDIIKLIEFAKKGPPSAKVYDIEVEWLEAKDDLPHFKIVYW